MYWILVVVYYQAYVKETFKISSGKVLMPEFALSMKSYVDRRSQKCMF